THKGFERPYGWGLFLKLALEINLLAKENDKAEIWAKNLEGIADFLLKNLRSFCLRWIILYELELILIALLLCILL
ncbi:DUF2891 domain-containing protein, partial [Campylobacter jejuni]|nr:DUF2891 domain-containing protein [Campylobacter jejuni]